MGVVPDGVGCNWKLSAEDIKNLTAQLIERTKKTYDEVGAVDKNDVTLDNVLMKLSNEEYEYFIEEKNVGFPQHTAVDKVVREASTDGDKALSELDVELSMRQDVFNNLVALKEKKVEMSAEQTRWLDRMIRNGRRNGLHLSEEVQAEVKGIKKEISDLEIEFNKNLNEENTILEFAKEELSGLGDDFVNALDKTEDGTKLQVSLKYPHYFPCMRMANNPETRKKLNIAFYQRCMEENTKILERLVELRHKKAKVLGYETHSDFVTEIQMSKTSSTVKNFLGELAKKMKPLGENDRALMLKLKKDECAKLEVPFNGKIDSWDMRYYMNLIEKENYSVDHEKIKEYFPVDVVTKGLFDLYQSLLSLKFTLLPDAEVWHPEVTMYEVHDSRTSEPMGHFYLDLYPREGKFGHAACFPLQPGCLKKDGTRMKPISAMVANFPKATAGKPALFTHQDVVTFFHEFGHAMHGICAGADLSMFSGTRVERDFVEAPSQMLENWVWEKEVLKRISSHYQDNSQLPDSMIDALIRSRNANQGVFNLRQILLGTFDLNIHVQEKVNTAEIFAKCAEEILEIAPPEGTNLPASFGHLGGGYDSRYYGYMWSEVFSMDMFATCFKRDGIFNPDVGMKYRNCILKPGGSLDATEMIRNFLGREPNDKAFLISKGLQIDS